MRGFISPAGEVHSLDGPEHQGEYAHHLFAGAQLGMSRAQVETEIIRNFDQGPQEELYAEIYRRGWLRLQDAYVYPGFDRPRTLVLTARAGALEGAAWEALLGVLRRDRIRQVDMELVGENGGETYSSMDIASFRERSWSKPSCDQQ